MFDAFCLGLALTVGQGAPVAPMPIPSSDAGRAAVGDELPRRIPAALPSVTVPSAPMPIPGRVSGIPVVQNKDAGTPSPATPAEPMAEEKKNGDDEKKDEEKKPEEKGYFMEMIQGTPFGAWMEENRIKAYGFVEGSYTHGTYGKMNWPISFQSPTDVFLLNQNWVTIEKTVDTDSQCPSWGFRLDAIIPGSDARFVRQRYLFDGQQGKYQMDLYQFYLEYYDPSFAKGLDVKVGRFAVPYMAEVTPATGNALFSHSYAYYYNPFTHTGVWTTVNLDDNLSVGLILSLGNDVFFGPAANGMAVGIVQWTSTDKNDTALLCVGISTGRFDVAQNFGNQDHIDLVYTHKFDDKLKYTLDTGIGWEKEIPGIAETTWSWMVNYLTYDFSDQVSGTTRFELFHDPEGFKTGSEGLYYAVTAGLTLKPTNCLWFRPEVRYDRNCESRPFNNRHGVCTAAADMILKW